LFFQLLRTSLPLHVRPANRGLPEAILERLHAKVPVLRILLEARCLMAVITLLHVKLRLWLRLRWLDWRWAESVLLVFLEEDRGDLVVSDRELRSRSSWRVSFLPFATVILTIPFLSELRLLALNITDYHPRKLLHCFDSFSFHRFR